MSAVPADRIVGCASGGVIAAGRYRLPAWRRAISAGQVAQIGANKLSDLDPQANPAINPVYPLSPEWRGSDGQADVVKAWCGACWDEATLTMWLPLGGGHGGYAGNEPYRGKFGLDSPLWDMLRPPSGAIGNLLTTNDGQESTGSYSDGRPRAIHSYNKHVYIPGVGPLCIVQGNTAWSAGGGTSRALLLNEITGEATSPVTHPSAGSSTSGAGACYDESRHCVWYRSAANGRLHKLDVATWTWNVNSTWMNDADWGYRRLVYLPEHDVVVQLDSLKTGGFIVHGLTTGVFSAPGVSNSVPTGLAWNGQAGAEWDGSRLLIWNNDAGATHKIFTLTPGASVLDQWTWGEITFSGVTPTVRTVNGTYGRFVYSARLKGCVLQNLVGDKPYFFAIE